MCTCTSSRLPSFPYNQRCCTRSEYVATCYTSCNGHVSCRWPKCACAPSLTTLQLARTLHDLILPLTAPNVRALPNLAARHPTLPVLLVHLEQAPLVIVILDVDSSPHAHPLFAVAAHFLVLHLVTAWNFAAPH